MALQVHGHAMRQARAWYRTAWMTSYVLSGLVGKKAPRPEKLLGPELMALLRPRTTRPLDDDEEND